MRQALDTLIDVIIDDFSKFVKADEEKINTFKNSIEIHEGSKYIRIECNGSAWGFINKSNQNFHTGDIFKPKNWKAPTLNRARGNILSGKYSINWTGPMYLHDIAGPGFYSWQSHEIARTA
jgi:hypothetical protein